MGNFWGIVSLDYHGYSDTRSNILNSLCFIGLISPKEKLWLFVRKIMRKKNYKQKLKNKIELYY